jgi:Fibronectin type 3 domain-containing protein
MKVVQGVVKMFRIIAVSVALFALLFVAGCGSSQAPATPTGLTVTATGPITLSWTASSGASSYVIFRGTASGAITTKTLLAAGVSGTSYADSSALAGPTYYYQITALNDDGQSSPSTEIGATLTSFTLTGVAGSLQAELAWASVPNATSYNVYRGMSSGDISGKTVIPAAAGLTGLTYIDTSVTAGTTYYYQVEAVYPAGTTPVYPSGTLCF